MNTELKPELKKEVEADDPMLMIGMEIPGQSEADLRDMALCFAEEFAREGWDEDRLLWMFRCEFYHGPHLVWKQKGEAYVREVIREALAIWNPQRRKS